MAIEALLALWRDGWRIGGWTVERGTLVWVLARDGAVMMTPIPSGWVVPRE